MKKAITIAAAFLCGLCATAQHGFERYYPSNPPYDKTAREVLPTSDGGYIMAGYSNNANPADCDVMVMKTNGDGDKLWEKTHGGSKPDYSYGMVEDGDGNYLIAGWSQSYGGGDEDIYLLKVDGSGNFINKWTYGGTGNEEAREIIKTSDGNFALVGSSTSSVSSQQIVVIRVDKNGSMLGPAWYYGGPGVEFGNSIKQCADGGFIILGQTFSWGQDGDTYVVRTNSTGDTLWTRYFGTSLAQEGISIVADANGAFTFVVRDSTATKDIDVRVMRIDANGALDGGIGNGKVYGAALKDTPKRIRATSDGGYIVGAISRSFEAPQADPPPDMWVMKLNSSLDTTWTRLFGPASNHEHCYDVKEAPDGDYLAVGHTKSFPEPGQKVYFIKMNTSGNVVVSAPSLSMESSVRIYPNPAANGFIQVDNLAGNSSIQLMDVSGRLVQELNARSANARFDVSMVPRGVYILKVTDGSSTLSRRVIVE